MKENQNGRVYDSQSLGRAADPLDFGSKELYIKDTNPLVSDVKGTDECWNPKFVDEFSMDNQNATRDSTENEFQNGPSCRPSSLEEDAKDNLQSSSEHECSDQNEHVESMSPCNAALDLFETDTKSYADKNVIEYEPPEVVVCDKEINYHVVKDICIDEGVPVNDKSLIESSKDNSECRVTEGAADMELFLSDGLATSSVDCAKGVCPNEHGSKEENHEKIFFFQEMPISPAENSFDKDAVKLCDDAVDSLQKGETEFGSSGKTASNAAEEDSFINSLGGEDNKDAQPQQDQISSGKAVSASPPASSAESGPLEDVQTSSLYLNSDVEDGSITFNFNSQPPVAAGISNEKAKNIEKQSVDMLDHKDSEADNHSDSRQVHCNSSKDTIIGQAHEQSLNIKNELPNDLSDEKVHDQSPDQKVENPDDVSSDCLLQSVQTRVLKKYENSDIGNDSVVSQGSKNDVGESSFSAAGLITYSGPIAYSGSLSLRSDGSATSGKSFAFPILQSEWNSSPVRMTKADRRHFRKHKGWRSGLLCCRF